MCCFIFYKKNESMMDYNLIYLHKIVSFKMKIYSGCNLKILMNGKICKNKLKNYFVEMILSVNIPMIQIKMILMQNEIDEMFNLQKYEDSTQTI